MNNCDMDLSLNTKAILLLTAPLIAGGKRRETRPLTAGEYNKLAGRLHALGVQPADLLHGTVDSLLEECSAVADRARFTALLGRGFALSQAARRWQARAIWVVSRADDTYPRILKERLKRDAPALLYGCGNREIVSAGGALAIVGSRNVDASLLEYTRGVSALAAKAGRAVVSGAARGVDRAAMDGALQAGGKAVGVLAGGLEGMSTNRRHRNLLLEERLVLVSAYDPGAKFNVGHAMQRNKVIYASADAALVVNAVVNKGGTWAGAVEQLKKYSTPVHVRSIGDSLDALEALQRQGAKPWPNPVDVDGLKDVLEATTPVARPTQPKLSPVPAAMDPKISSGLAVTSGKVSLGSEKPAEDYAQELHQTIRSLIPRVVAIPKKAVEVSEELNVTKRQAEEWLKRLVTEGVIEKQTRPVRYVRSTDRLFQDKRSAETGADINPMAAGK